MIIDSAAGRLKNNVANLEHIFKNKNNRKFNALVPPDKCTSFPEMWTWLGTVYARKIALKDPYHAHSREYTYSALDLEIELFAAGIQHLGLEQGEKVSLFSENSSRWLIADQGTLKAGCVNAVRSSGAPIEELLYILNHSKSSALIVETPELYKKLAPYLSEYNLKCVIVLWGNKPASSVYSYNDVILAGQKNSFQPVNLHKNSPATIIYTSGTTGKPKGAVLSHGNLLHQVNNLNDHLYIDPKGTALSILPVWHAYERSCSYFLFSVGTTMVYTNLRNFKLDFHIYNPNYLIAVPRLYEAIYTGVKQELGKQSQLKQKLVNAIFASSERYIKAKRTIQKLDYKNLNPSIAQILSAFLKAGISLPVHKLGDIILYKKIRQALGTSFKKGISGGGALADHLEDFFEIAGIEILVGYGLTETSPVITVRSPKFNLRGSVGRPIPYTEIKIVNPEDMQPVPQGQKGVVMARGLQIMQGYYRDPVSTAKAIDSQEWFNTGDVGWLTKNNDLILTGRIKDLIVLSNGEKVEPQPIEDVCIQSRYVKQIMLTGQDQKALGAVVVPETEALELLASETGMDISDLNNKQVIDFYQKEINRFIKNRSNYRSYEILSTIRLISEQFSTDNGLLTQTLKIKRLSVVERYSELISDMFKSF